MYPCQVARAREETTLTIEPVTESDRPAVSRLVELCNSVDDLDLPFDPDGEGLVYREDGSISGYVGIDGGRVVEATGVVHPDHRRRGIGTALLNALISSCRERRTETCYVVLDEASTSGKSFITDIGAGYHISEFRMELDRERFQPVEWTELLSLDPAGADDLDLFASVAAAGFGDPVDQLRGWLAKDMALPGRRIWIVRRNGEPVGTVRTTGLYSDVYTTTLAVLPEYRGRGYGRQVLSRITEMLSGEDWERILIEVETENRNALGLYQSVGYDVVRTYGFYELEL